jgi:hypothetical protein
VTLALGGSLSNQEDVAFTTLELFLIEPMISPLKKTGVLTFVLNTLVILAGVSITSRIDTLYAQSSGEPVAPIKIIHKPLQSGSIPTLGTPMRVDVELLNTFDIESKVRLIGAKDGRFIDIAFPQGALNAVDHPTFHIEIPSPVAAMTYQFVVHQRDGTLSSSERFTIKRSCIQNFKVAVPEDAPNGDFRREVSTLISQAKSLERDTASLESSLKLLEDIKASLTN